MVQTIVDAIVGAPTAVPARARYPQLKLLEMSKLLGKSKDYPEWQHKWAQKVERAHKEKSQLVFIKDYIPKSVWEEIVGYHVTMMAEIWAQMDKKFGDLVTVSLDICKELTQLTLQKNLGSDDAGSREGTLHGICAVQHWLKLG